MNFLKNFRVGVRLAIAFSLVLTLLLLVSLVGINAMTNISGEATKIYERELVGLSKIKEANINLVYTGRALRGALLEDDVDGRNKAYGNAKKFFDKAMEQSQSAESHFSSEEAKKQFAIIKESSKRYGEQLVELEQKMKTAELVKSNSLSEHVRVTMRENANAMDDAMGKLSELKEKNATESAKDATATYEDARNMMIIIAAVAALIGVIAGFVVARSITRPLGELQETLGTVEAQGDFSKRVNYNFKDEVGSAATAFNNLMEALQRVLGNTGQIMAGVSQGDLRQRVTADAKGELEKLKSDINSTIDVLGKTMVEVGGNARQVATASAQTSNAIGQISDGAQNQKAAIGQVATAIKQTAASVTDVSGNTEAASQKAKESVELVKSGQEKMQRMVEVVNNISNNSQKINKITEAIEKIANKTNLLSLNAAIEAARAGEHGKGFAVVAEEVGKLAANAAESTQEIAQLVAQAVSEADRASTAVKEVSGDMLKIADGATATDAMLQRIAAALEQQSAAVQEVNANVGHLNKIADNNATAAEEIAATVVELSKVADATRANVERFRT